MEETHQVWVNQGQRRSDNTQKIRESEKSNFENLVSPPTFTAEKLYSERLTDWLILQVSYRMKQKPCLLILSPMSFPLTTFEFQGKPFKNSHIPTIPTGDRGSWSAGRARLRQ